MIPEITITCRNEKMFVNSITVGQYKKYVEFMEKNSSEARADAMFFNKKIVQSIFGNRMSLEDIGEIEAVEFLDIVKKIHFIMQEIILEKILNIVKADKVEKEKSAFDEYDIENGYEEEEEKNIWQVCREIIDRIIKIAIRVLKNSYSQCMHEDIIQLAEYLKYELETIDEN